MPRSFRVRCPSVARLSVVLLLMAVSPQLALPGPAAAQDGTVRILQTNSAGDDVHVIDPETRRVVDVIDGIPIPHGVTHHPDGHVVYVSNEHDETLDVVSTRTLEVTKQIPLTGGPHNLSITPDGEKVYVGIHEFGEVAGVDVIATAAERRVAHVPTPGPIHNVYVTPDGRHAVAGSIVARTLTVIDADSDEALWTMEFDQRRPGASPLYDGGVRPMEFETAPDGSTRRIFVQISGWHGFYVVDVERREVTRKVELPKRPLSRVDNDALQGSPSHGLEVTADGRTLWVASKPHNAVYAYSLPGLQLVGRADVGYHPDWLTSTPDGRYVYAANAGSNDVSVVDRETMEEIARIPVGHTPKRNHTAVFR